MLKIGFEVRTLLAPLKRKLHPRSFHVSRICICTEALTCILCDLTWTPDLSQPGSLPRAAGTRFSFLASVLERIHHCDPDHVQLVERNRAWDSVLKKEMRTQYGSELPIIKEIIFVLLSYYITQ